MPSTRPILKNFISLASAEIISKIISFIATVYLARTLTVGGYGIIGFATAFISYFILLVQFGFDTIGTRDIAKNSIVISKLANNIISLRAILALPGYLVLLLIIFFIKDSDIIREVVIIAGIQLFANIIQLNYVFQGTEKMQFIGIRQAANAMMILAGYFLLVKNSDDVVTAAWIITAGNILANLWLLRYYVKNIHKIKFEFDPVYWKYLLKESFPVALSAIMIAVYYNLDMVMLGYLKSESDVGIYSAAYKIFLLGIIPYSLILNSFFPSLSKYDRTKGSDLNWVLNRYALAIIPAGIFVAIILFLFSNELTVLIFGEIYSSASIPLTVLALNALVISVNMLFGNPLLAWGKQKNYLIIVTAGAIANIILNIILIPKYSFLGASFATLLSEVVVFVGVVVFFTKYMIGK